MSENNWNGDDQRRFSRMEGHFAAEFQLLNGSGAWLAAEVLDFTIAGIRVCFERKQRGIVLNETEMEWQEALFRFRGDALEEFLLKGHFLMIYEKYDGWLTTGFEFLEISPELQIKLIRFYAERRRERERSG